MVCLTAALLATACVADGADRPASSASGDTETTERVAFSLPEREGPRRETSGSVPHVQIDSAPVAAVDAELRRRVFLLPGVSDEPSTVSLPGAWASSSPATWFRSGAT